MTVPNGFEDTATFDSSSVSDVSILANTEVKAIVFSSLAQLTPFTITATPGRTLTLDGTGTTNNSGVTQDLITAVDDAGNAGVIVFATQATAGSRTLPATPRSELGRCSRTRVVFSIPQLERTRFLRTQAAIPTRPWV